jgi:hypothetical protein
MTMKSYAEHTAKAQELWASFDANERYGVKFGLFPHAKMTAAEAEGYDGHRLVVALMDLGGTL